MSKAPSTGEQVVGLLTEIRDLLAQGQSSPASSPADDDRPEVTGD